MGLTPLDIYNKEFKKQAIGGLSKDEVDDFLDEVMHEMENLLKENAAFKEQVNALNLKLEHYRSLEDALNRTLIVAQSTADDIKANARREADLVIQEARLQAERIVDAGHSKSRKLLEQQADLLRAVDVLRGQLRSMGREMTRLADQLPEETPPVHESPAVVAEAAGAVAAAQQESVPEYQGPVAQANEHTGQNHGNGDD